MLIRRLDRYSYVTVLVNCRTSAEELKYFFKVIMNNNTFHWCLVPDCKNTSVKTPGKLWIQVPNNIKRRNTWLKLARRDTKSLSTNTRLYFCEDHFDLKNDMANYTEYKLMGSVKRIRMKPNCIPSRFYCQADIKYKSTPCKLRQDFIERQRISAIKEFEEIMEDENSIKSSSSQDFLILENMCANEVQVVQVHEHKTI